jgi:hypothetical protein
VVPDVVCAATVRSHGDPDPAALDAPASLVVRLREASTPHRRSSSDPIELGYGYRSGYRVDTPRETLRALDVSRFTQQRALRVMQALIDESGRRGYEIRESRPSPSRVTEIEIVIQGHGFAITISEKEGKLRLWLPHAYGGRRQWNDRPRGLIESKLGEMLASLEERARELEERRLAREGEERRREGARQRAIERARERYAEAFRAEVLKRQVEAARFASDIRSYCKELRALIPAHSPPLGALEWITWAEDHARAIDPLLQVPTMPDVPEPRPEDLRPFLQASQTSDPFEWR